MATTKKTPTQAKTFKVPETAPAMAPKGTVKGAEPEVVVTESPTIVGPELKKKELIDIIVARSGVKKRDVKPVVDAMLAVLGETISDGREMNLAPLGKLKITRMKKTTKAHIITTRLRRTDPQPTDAPDPLAQAAE